MRLIKRTFDEMFPRPWYHKLNPFYRTVAKDVLELPPKAQKRCLDNFLRHQAESMGMEVDLSEPSTDPNDVGQSPEDQ